MLLGSRFYARPGRGPAYLAASIRADEDTGSPSGFGDTALAATRAVAGWVRQNPFDAAALGLSPLPVVGDIAGLANDVRHYWNDPESRSWGNYGLTALGLLPWVPPVAGITRSIKKLKQIQVGDFGPVFENPGDWKSVVEGLRQEKAGEVRGALSHPEIADPIDVVWGQAGSERQRGYGLAKIDANHPEVIDDLPEHLGRMRVRQKTASAVHLRSKDYRAAVRLEWDGQRKTWLLTTYRRERGR